MLGGGMGMHTHKVKTGAGLTAAEQTKRRAEAVPWGSLGVIQGWSNIIIRECLIRNYVNLCNNSKASPFLTTDRSPGCPACSH